MSTAYKLKKRENTPKTQKCNNLLTTKKY